jgi:hypothetical protein
VTDPHYDAQFRRGYDGPPVPPPVSSAPTSAASRTQIPVAPLENPTPSHPSVDEQAGAVGVVVTDQEPEPVRRRNPWTIVLLVVGLVMLVVGGWLLRAYVAATTVNGYSPSEQLPVFLMQAVSPALLICGFIAVIAWLVVGALAARPRS